MVIGQYGPPDVLQLAEVPTPEPGPGEALITVQAVSVNTFLDVATRAGQVPFARTTFPHVLGSEHAGVVAGYGPDTDRPLPLGTAVAIRNNIPCGHCKLCLNGRPEACPQMELLGVTRPGAYAEYTVVPTSNLVPLPPDMDPIDAAAMAQTGPLAVMQLTEASIEAGDSVLVHAAASATGTMAAIVARAMGARVIGTTRDPLKAEHLRKLDLYDELVDSRDPDAADAVRRASGGGVDIVIDNVGAPQTWDLTMAVVAPMASIMTSGALAGGQLPLDLAALYRGSHRVIGIRAASAVAHTRFWDLAGGKAVHPVIDSVFALTDAANAHRRLEAMSNIGRVLLRVS